MRSRHVENNATAGVAVRLTPKFSVEVAGRIDETRFDADAEFDGIRLQRTLEPARRPATASPRATA